MLAFSPQQSTVQIAVTMTPTSTVLDESLLLLKQFLMHKLIYMDLTETKKELPGRIDIAFLGLHKPVEDPQQFRQDGFVYPIKIHHSSVILGPLYIPGPNACPCPHCLEKRWLSTRTSEEQDALETCTKILAFSHHPRLLPPTFEAIWSIVEVDLYRQLSDDHRDEQKLSQNQVQPNMAHFYKLHFDTLSVTQYQLLADSCCPVCAQPSLDEPEAVQLQLSPHNKAELSSYRLVTPLAYNLPVKGLVNPVCGLLGAEAIVNYRHTVTAMVSGQWQVKTKDYVNTVGWGGHHTRIDSSRCVGLLEGLERYCGHWPRTRTSRLFESYEAIASDALDIQTCGLYHQDTYHASEGQLEPYSPTLKMAWVWGYSFRHRRPILVPEGLAFYGSTNNGAPPCLWESSNGCAIGSCMEEAILHGLMELIERDGFLLSWYAQLAPPRIDPWSSHHQETLYLLDRIDHLGYDIHLLDTRFDIALPSVTVVIERKDDELGKLMVAAAASLNPQDAIRSALCEVACYIPGMRERVTMMQEELSAMVKDHTRVTQLEHHSLIYGFPDMAQSAHFLLQNSTLKSIDETYEQWYGAFPRQMDLRADLQYCLDMILQLGLDVLVVDQTAPELMGTGLKVVKVIVPGLIPIDFGWGHNRVFGLPRLRTVPRTSGFMATDFDLAHLNLTPHPFP